MTESIFDSPANTIVCPTNGVGVMGKGLALEFARRFPGLLQYYKDSCTYGLQQPGQLDFFLIYPKWICLFPTKRHWKDKSRIEDIELGLINLAASISKNGEVVALPHIGCGLGGLSWKDDVLPLVQTYLRPEQYIIYEGK